jgi:hypothetical protein
MFSIVIGCTTVLPMVVAPEAIVESFLSIGSSILSSQIRHSCVNFAGCATSAPDSSSPRGYKEVLVACYRLKNNYSLLFLHRRILQKSFCFCSFSSSRRSMLLIRIAPEAISGFFGKNHSFRSFPELVILSTLFDTHDVTDRVTLYDDLTGR